MKRIFTFGLTMLILLAFAVPVSASEETLSEDIVILYTNDVHTYIDGPLSYDVLAAIKKDLQTQYKYVFLADAGDHVQGTAYGAMDKGKTIVELMNETGYDVAALGNHEFDYGTSVCLDNISLAKYRYLSANFYHESDGVRGENVLDSYALFDCGDQKIAFVGITTPETFSKSSTTYFQDENGKFIYGISGGKDGAAMQQDIQNAIDDAKAEGATRIVAVGHLGVDPSSGVWMSDSTIANLSGLDAFIDGHSHTVVEGTTVKDKDGNDVLLAQTGDYFEHIGMMIIDAETGEIDSDLIACEALLGEDGETVEGYRLVSDLYDGTELISDASVKQIKDAWMSEIDEKLGQTVGSATVTFDNYDSEGNRLVRSGETNSGNFAADALYYLFDNMGLDVDIAIMNGGGIRNKTLTGDITYKLCKDMHTFGNVACLQTVTGQQILDALEWGVRKLGNGESGGFLQVSGLTYRIDPSVESTVQFDELDTWTGGPTGAYRVYDVKIYNKETNAWDKLELDVKYNLAGYNYTLRDLGDGFAMFGDAVNVLDYVMEDYMVLANYIDGFENDVVGADNSPLLAKYPGLLLDYSNVAGCGRITVAEAEKAPDTSDDESSEDSSEELSDADSSVPQTGDGGIIWLWLIPLTVSAAGLAILCGRKRGTAN